jgi:hypothetical protein
LLTVNQLIKKYDRIFHTDYTTGHGCLWAGLYTEGSGTTIADATGNGRTLNFKSSGHPAWASLSGTGAPAYDTYQNDYNGGDWSTITYGSWMNVNYISAGGWINCASISQYNPLVIRDDRYGAAVRYFAVGVNDLGNPYYYIWNTSDTLVYYDSNDHRDISAGVWNHLFMTRGASYAKLYRNGAIYTSATNAVTGTLKTGSELISWGAEYTNASHYLSGSLTEGAIFDNELDATAVNEIYTYGLKPAGGTVATPSLVRASFKIQSPTASATGGYIATPALVRSRITIATPTISAGKSYVVTPALVRASFVIKQPSISSGGSAIATPTKISGRVSILSPSISISRIATPALIRSRITITAPTASTSSSTAATPSLLRNRLVVNTPSISFTSNRIALPSIISARFSILSPVVYAQGAASGINNPINLNSLIEKNIVRSSQIETAILEKSAI